VFAGKPIIGIAGGIGSGKSRVARLFGELGCAVIDSDAQVRDVYAREDVRRTLKQWWGEGVFKPGGELDRAAVAARVFSDPGERARLEALVHPLVAEARDEAMRAAARDPQLVAFVWDTPLLFEVGLRAQCDAVVFVDAPLELRLRRVRRTRGWDAAELARRENLQWPLDRKRNLSDDVVTNTADAGEGSASPAGACPPGADPLRDQVRQVLSRILARTAQGQRLD
jgi:dephospho-CoA kinase